MRFGSIESAPGSREKEVYARALEKAQKVVEKLDPRLSVEVTRGR